MGFDSVIRNAIGIANSLTSSLQAEITLEQWTGQNDQGKPTYGSVKRLMAIIDKKQTMRKDAGGQDIVAKHALTILKPIKANGADGRQEPIDPRDRITLPDGTTGPIVDIQGTVDPGAKIDGDTYITEVFLG